MLRGLDGRVQGFNSLWQPACRHEQGAKVAPDSTGGILGGDHSQRCPAALCRRLCSLLQASGREAVLSSAQGSTCRLVRPLGRAVPHRVTDGPRSAGSAPAAAGPGSRLR